MIVFIDCVQQLMSYLKRFGGVLAFGAGMMSAWGNVAPTVVIQSAAMRPGTTFMDVVYRVNDADDATVKVRALAFVDGVRSFANVLRPVTFVEGTAAKLGDAIPTNQNQTLTWDVGADWNISLGQIKFEVLAMDGRGLLPFDWITIPATANTAQTTVSKNSPSATEVLNALFWRFADGDTGLAVTNGVLKGTPASGVFYDQSLVNGATVGTYATPFVFKRMNLAVDDGYVANLARAGLTDPTSWHAGNRAYDGTQVVVGWGRNLYGETTPPSGLSGATAIAAGATHGVALKSDGTVVGWGSSNGTPPSGLSGVTAIAAGYKHTLALKSDGTVVGWGENPYGGTSIPSSLTGVIAVGAGAYHSLAVKSDGSVVCWGLNSDGQATPPAGLTGVVAVTGGYAYSLALKSDGTVVKWGTSAFSPPVGLTGVTAIAGGTWYCLALKSDGTVVGWGFSSYGEAFPPSGLTGVVAISAGENHCLALKSDGTVVGWGRNVDSSGIFTGQATPPATLTGVSAIAAGAGGDGSLALKTKAE